MLIDISRQEIVYYLFGVKQYANIYLKAICIFKEEIWRQAAKKFAVKTDFSHCLEAEDGKNMGKLKNTGSQFFKYKN